jgi:hypothetical protein
VADTEVGQGGTTLWKMAGLDQDTSVAVFFEVTGNNANAEQVRRRRGRGCGVVWCGVVWCGVVW